MALGDSFHVWSRLGKQSYQEYGFQGSDMRRLDQMKPRGLKRTSHFFPLALSTHQTLGLREWTQHLDGAWTLYRGLLHTLKSPWRGQDTEHPCGTGCLDILPHRKKWQDRSLLGPKSTHQHWKKKNLFWSIKIRLGAIINLSKGDCLYLVNYPLSLDLQESEIFGKAKKSGNSLEFTGTITGL